MTVFENLQSLIDDANAAVLDFQGKLDALDPLLTERDGEDATPIPLDEYICSIVSQCGDDEEETEGGTGEKRWAGLNDCNDDTEKDSEIEDTKRQSMVQGVTNYPDISPAEQLQAEIEALKNQIKAVELLRFEIAKMPGKEELIAAVLTHLPQENKRISADSPAITRRASDPYD